MKLILEGRVDTSGKVALDNGMFNACAVVGGVVVGTTQVNASGEYRLEIDTETMPEAVELQVLPASAEPGNAGKLALSKQISTARFQPQAGDASRLVASDKFFLPVDYLDFVRRRLRNYHVHGSVYLDHGSYFSTLAGCRIDFYEVDRLGGVLGDGLPGFRPLLRQDYLGSAYSRADGTYDFNFKFGTLLVKPTLPVHPVLPTLPTLPLGGIDLPTLPIVPKLPNPFIDTKPDIRARFFLFIDGAWTQIYEAPMMDFDWDIDPDYHRDYRIPAEAAAGAVEPGTPPATGFRFKSIGLLPVDTTRIVDGYAHSQPGDPVSGIVHEPFCGTLRIHGLFAAAPPVLNYTVEILRTNASGTTLAGEAWRPLGDALVNLRWDDTDHRWEPVTLGATEGRYQNVDILDPMAWLEPSLKAVWNTANCVNGYYSLRITGYDASNTVVVTEYMPVICIDNDLPQADLDVIAPAATVCGDLSLGADRSITFRVTAYDADGHLHSYSLTGSRGRYAESAGAGLYRGRPVANANWDGVINAAEPFAVALRSAPTIVCATMAYNFQLCVQGAGTNGYGNCLASKRVWRESNLVVTE